MNTFCLAPGTASQDAVEALAMLAPALTGEEPVAAWSRENPRTAVFASMSLLELLEARNLQDFSDRLREAGAIRLTRPGAKLVLGGPPSLERVRFNLGGATRSLTFDRRLVRLRDGREIVVAAVVDCRNGVARSPSRKRAGAPNAKASPLARPEEHGGGSRSTSPGNDLIRFLWRTDASGRIAEAGPPFSHFIGRPLLDVIDNGDPAQAAALARHLALRETWRCVTGFSTGGLAEGLAPGLAPKLAAFAPVMLAGMPKFDQDRRFEGYSGFGIVQSAPAARADDAPRPPAAEPLAGRASPQTAPAGAGSGSVPVDGREILAVLPVGALVFEGRSPVFVNRSFLDALRYRDLAAALDAGALEPLLEALPRLSRRSEIVELRAGDGRSVRLRASAKTIEWRGKKAALAMFQSPAEAGPADLESELRRVRNEARELNAILDTAMDGVAILDSKGNIVSLNRSGEALFGYDESDVAGLPFTVLIAPESRARTQDYFEGLISDGMMSLLNDGREVTALARQGGTIPIFMTLGRIDANSYPGADEREVRWCALLRDMTHWKKIERELDDARKEAERASALKSEFLAKVSHEIRTPLNAILGFAEVILEERFGPIGNARYKDYLKDVHSSGALVMSLVNDLLDLSKIEAGKMELDFTAVDANRIIAECVSIMQPQASRAGIVIRLSLAPRLPQVFADERSVRQIVLNLLSNAVKFNVPGGHVSVATAVTEAGQAALRIRDTGVGMSAADIKVALEPFRQVAASRVSGGTGLGLPLTKALVEANRASFSIKSERDEGTLIEIAFPPAKALAD
ncbi:PAS domain-containing sensor histidine kinase [Methylocapsa palsarum]|nr:PAS domain-containing sensor histidine kinase [Methylocapsa palsarum]